jgi:hypothetical protein
MTRGLSHLRASLPRLGDLGSSAPPIVGCERCNEIPAHRWCCRERRLVFAISNRRQLRAGASRNG